jgi:hypothetical protein
MGKFQTQDHNTRRLGKTKNKMVGHHPEGHVTDSRNMKMEKRGRQRKWRCHLKEARAQQWL